MKQDKPVLNPGQYICGLVHINSQFPELWNKTVFDDFESAKHFAANANGDKYNCDDDYQYEYFVYSYDEFKELTRE